MPVLTQNKLVEALHGKGGGYRLTRRPQEYTVAEIVELTEGDLAPVACLTVGAEPCRRRDTCRTIAMWTELHGLIQNFFEKKTLADLMI